MAGASGDDEVHNVLTALYDRLGVVEGKVNLLARANAPSLVQELRKAIKQKPIYGQTYLLLDGKRTQQDLLALLEEAGIKSSRSALSRHLEGMREIGIADLVRAGTYRADPQTERMLTLTKKVRKWLADDGEIVPEAPKSGGKRKT